VTRTLRPARRQPAVRRRPAAQLLAAARAVGPALDPARLVVAVAEVAARVREGAVSTVRLAEAGDGGLRLVATAAPSGVRRHAATLDDDLAVQALGAPRPLRISDVRLDPRARRRALWRERGYAAWYGFPLLAPDGPVGVLGVALPSSAAVLAAHERRLLEMYAAQAALAVRAGRLAATVERQSAALEVAKTELLEAGKLLALGHLVSDVVHEASNVLGTITLRMEALLEGPRDAETETQLHALDAHCRQIADLLGELRRFSAGSGPSAMPVDIGASLERLLKLREPRLRIRGVRLERALAASLPVVAGDRPQLERALLALLLEAEAALARGGVITVRTAVRADPDGARVTIALEDDGPSIGIDLLPHVFDPFAPRVKGRGPSIGLAAAHAIIHAHHGRLTAGNRPGRGAVFLVDLPAASR
jgi:signal transduction histidine kinase